MKNKRRYQFIFKAVVLVLVAAMGLTGSVAGKATKLIQTGFGKALGINVMVPIQTVAGDPVGLTAKAVMILDPVTQTVLYEKNSGQLLPPASTTKMMSALVAVKLFDLNEVVTITNAPQAMGSKAELIAGEQLTVADLLFALLLSSGNDAAVALAEYHPLGYFGFVAEMNRLSRTMGLSATFTNVSGIDAPGHLASARDLAIIANELMKNQILKDVVSRDQVEIKSVDGKLSHTFTNLNLLLTTVEGVKGIKTGRSEEAGECLVTWVERDNRKIVTVALGSQDRFGETTHLIEWVYSHFTWPSGVLLGGN